MGCKGWIEYMDIADGRGWVKFEEFADIVDYAGGEQDRNFTENCPQRP